VTALPRPCVYLVTDRRQLAPDARTADDAIVALESWLAAAIDAGVDVIQLREPDLDARRLVDCVRRLVARASRTHTAVLVNDRADIALAGGAHGVHLRADGPAVERIRGLGPPEWIVGRSVHNVAEATTASAAGSDYLLFGTMFSGGTKVAPRQLAGLAALREVVQASRTPVIAIGGIDPERAVSCLEAGAAGVAAISLFLPAGAAALAMGPDRAVAVLRQRLAESLPRRTAPC
jgi:thiamine-phosphate pyrophosphorylase